MGGPSGRGSPTLRRRQGNGLGGLVGGDAGRTLPRDDFIEGCAPLGKAMGHPTTGERSPIAGGGPW
jgi:hypothetical protein